MIMTMNTLQLCCKCAVHLCVSNKKNDCQSVQTVVDAACNIFKEENKEKKKIDGKAVDAFITFKVEMEEKKKAN